MPRSPREPIPELVALGARIRTRRTTLGLSQQTLADLIGVSRTVVSFWETGRVEPLTLSLAALARHLRVSIDRLLADDPAEPLR